MDTPADPCRQPDRSPLSRDRIVAAAIAFVDRKGLTDLTMRRLGTELGVEAMSLYRYVAGRDDLLEGMVEQLVAPLHLGPGGGRPEPGGSWQAYLHWLAHGVRALAREHPRVFPLIATRHPAAPWLRPPLRSLRVVEDLLGTLVARGFSEKNAVAAYRAFSGFLLGHLLLEATTVGRPAPTVAYRSTSAPKEVDLREFPLLRRLEDRLSEDRAGAEFERALEDLLARLEHDLGGDLPD